MRFSIAFAILVLASAISICFGGNWDVIDKDETIKVEKGKDKLFDNVKVQVFTPAGKVDNGGAIIFIHGGGFIQSLKKADDGKTYKSISKYIAKET